MQKVLRYDLSCRFKEDQCAEAWGEFALRHCCHRLPFGAVILLGHFPQEVVNFSQLMCSIALESHLCMGWTVCVQELGAVL